MMGEWNDCINNDIMFLKRDVIEPMLENGSVKFILVGENVLNFHQIERIKKSAEYFISKKYRV
jgi:hypothetical protein